MGLFGELLSEPQNGENTTASGVILGVVKQNWDDKHPGMLKVEFLQGETGKNVSNWLPVMTPYAGNGFGLYLLPEIGTQVVLAFEYGNIMEPIVIGCLWNQSDTQPSGAMVEKNSIKTFATKGGNKITIAEEESGKEKLTIETAGGLKISMDEQSKSITLQDKDNKNSVLLDASNGALNFKADKKMVFNVGGKSVLTLDGDATSATLKTSQVTVEAEQTLKLKGQTASLEGNSLNVKGQNTTVEGNALNVTGKGSTKVESSGMLQLKGSMVKIN